MAARALGQTSKFGAILDMVTDRSVPLVLLVFLPCARRPPTDGSRQQMHDLLSALLPRLGVPEIRPPLPVPHLARLFLPLHPHVCVSRPGHAFPLLSFGKLCRDFAERDVNVPGAHKPMTPLNRSISSGSSSHKKVTKEQSWILWSYYNNSASSLTPSFFTRRPSDLTLPPLDFDRTRCSSSAPQTSSSSSRSTSSPTTTSPSSPP
jgi:hypothetical protein